MAEYQTITYASFDPHMFHCLWTDMFYSCVSWLDECAAFTETEKDGGSMSTAACWVSCNLACQVGGLG